MRTIYIIFYIYTTWHKNILLKATIWCNAFKRFIILDATFKRLSIILTSLVHLSKFLFIASFLPSSIPTPSSFHTPSISCSGSIISWTIILTMRGTSLLVLQSATDRGKSSTVYKMSLTSKELTSNSLIMSHKLLSPLKLSLKHVHFKFSFVQNSFVPCGFWDLFDLFLGWRQTWI